MAFVLDASIVGCWAFPDEYHPVAERALKRLRDEDALVPSLWWFEVRNLLMVNERRKRITKVETTQFLIDLELLSWSVDKTPNESEVFRIARTHSLTIYDASYLELAIRRGVDLASIDSDLFKAARKEKVALVR